MTDKHTPMSRPRPAKPQRMTGSYRRAVEAIALNDEPNCLDIDEMSGYASVLVTAITFGKDQDQVAADVVRWRTRNNAR
jgi:hypothetical protein